MAFSAAKKKGRYSAESKSIGSSGWREIGLFMVSDDAHILRLNRLTGVVEWETEMADWHENYFATSAPLVIVGNLVISGTRGGENGVRGFLAAFDQFDG